ncbi:MAG TPA: peptide MFS transporter, partial [Povalibacter sp.]|uniref:peptide MFS transporter n=1 Tax=Povalibacter sp. TaxID=1962978 RepID=UPI002B8E1FB6
GLTILFLTEMWEKFSYYGMRTLLVYYMTKALLISQTQASWIYGFYTAFTYFTPIIGGVIADRYLGRRRAVIIGGAIMALGHFMMTFETLFYPALAIIGLGNGLFLPSLPSQVKSLYRSDDPRIGSAYNVYYVGINLGAVLAAIVCGALGELYGWHWGFGAAGVGMCLGLVVYTFGGRYLPAEVAAAVPRETDSRSDDSWRTRVALLLGVIAIVVVFRGAYEQIGNTVALWADSGVDRRIGASWTIPATWFQALNPLLVFTLTPILLAYWKRHADQQFAPLRRMAIGAFVVAGAYVLLALVAGQPQAHWLWLATFLLLYTLGELFILPTGLGLFGRIAPRNLAATAIALWFSASFAGNLLAGALGTLWSRFDRTTFFLIVAAVAAVAAVALLLVDRPSRRLLREENGVTVTERESHGAKNA